MKSGANRGPVNSQDRVENSEESLKMAEPAKVAAPPRFDAQEHKTSGPGINPQQIDSAVPGPVKLTGVGIRTIDKDKNPIIIDEAFWRRPPTASARPFTIIVSLDLGHLSDLTIQSRFLVSIIMGLLPRTDSMGVSKQHHSLSVKRPFLPLYWFYESIVEAAGNPDVLSKNDSRDLGILRYWYEKRLLAWHVEIRKTLNSSYVTFDTLWALYKPNDYVFRRDVFQQPRLGIVSSTSYDRNYKSRDLSMTRYHVNPPKFFIVLWHQDWNSTLQVFEVQAERRIIHFFAGSRRVTDLEFYPLRYYREGKQSDINDLLESLEARGRRWKALVSRPNYMAHKGPAIEMDDYSSGKHKYVRPYVSYHT